MEIVRDVEFIRWDDDDEEETPLSWSTAGGSRSLRQRYLCDVCSSKDLSALSRMTGSGWDVNETFRKKRETFTSFGSIVLHDNFRAIHQAARENWLEGVRMLLDSGADVNSLDYRDAKVHGFSHTALMYAATNGHLDLVRLLIARGADVNTRDPLTNNSPILLAAAAGSVSCVDVLLRQGACVGVVARNSDTLPSTPLLAAVYYFRLPSWHRLSHEWRSTDGRERSRRQALALMELLIDHGCDVNAYGSDLPPLHNSAACRDSRALELLLAAGANVNLVASGAEVARYRSTTALTEAARANNLSGVRLLVQHGAQLRVGGGQAGERQAGERQAGGGSDAPDTDGKAPDSLLSSLLRLKYYDIAATLVYAGWPVSGEERDKMAALSADLSTTSTTGSTAARGRHASHDEDDDDGGGGDRGGSDIDDDDDEDEADSADLMNLSERSQLRRMKAEALRWAVCFLSTPRPLKWRCRDAIRRHMRSCSPDFLQVLPLPPPLIRYVTCHDL